METKNNYQVNAPAPRTVEELYPSRFLRCEDLKGRKYVLIIAHVELERMRSRFEKTEQWKAVLYFVGAQKGLVLNKTQALVIKALAGSGEFERWVGIEVTLSPARDRGKDTIAVSAAPGKDLQDE